MLLHVGYFPQVDVIYMNHGHFEVDIRSTNYNILKDIDVTMIVFHVKKKHVKKALHLRSHTYFGIPTDLFIVDKVDDEREILFQCNADTDLNLRVHFS